MSGIYGKGAKGQATMWHSKIIRARSGGKCERCGRPSDSLQAAHIVGRRYAATRTDLGNGWALDAGCHMRLTEHPDEHVAFAIQTLGLDGYELLRMKAYDGKRVDWEAEAARLKAIAKEMGIA